MMHIFGILAAATNQTALKGSLHTEMHSAVKIQKQRINFFVVMTFAVTPPQLI